MPSDKKILLINVPFTFVDVDLCPLEQVSIDTLRLINKLESNNNKVFFFNTRSKDRFGWKIRNAGGGEGGKVQMSIASKPQNVISKFLKGLDSEIDEIWIVCNFSFSPYLFDLDVIASMVDICSFHYPGAEIKLGGTFVELFSDFIHELGIEKVDFEFEELKAYPPKLEVLRGEGYGLFQLTKGCSNNCSFCIAGREPLFCFNAIDVFKNVYDQYHGFGVSQFWCWDENVLIFRDELYKFFDYIIDSNIEIKINFALGFQPNLIDDDLIEYLKKMSFGVVTVPFESGKSETFLKINKPYTIIESIKVLDKINKNAQKSIDRIQSSFIIGYPHDDFRSIFRIYLSILRLNSIPVPFPLYVFPGTKEYEDNYNAVVGKSITSLHGQLWPLVQDCLVDDYRKLLRFLLIDNMEEAKDNIELLNEEMKEAFFLELRNNEYFVQMCLDSKDGSYESLVSIERGMRKCDDRNDVLLYITASPMGRGESLSRELGDYFCEKYTNEKGVDVICIDLNKEGLDFISSEYVDYINHNITYDEIPESLKKQIDLADRYIKMFRRADKILLATPMYTLSVPAILKAFFELVASKLFYDLSDRVEPKKVCAILTRDGVYTGRDTFNLQEKTIEACLNFIGIGTDIDFIVAEGLYSEKRKSEVLERVKKDIIRYISDF